MEPARPAGRLAMLAGYLQGVCPIWLEMMKLSVLL